MAAGTLPKPGTQYGPCKAKCTHRDCAQTRAISAAACTICAKPIGYDKRFYTEDGKHMHAVCIETKLDNERLHA